jgi:hypothetical protein
MEGHVHRKSCMIRTMLAITEHTKPATPHLTTPDNEKIEQREKTSKLHKPLRQGALIEANPSAPKSHLRQATTACQEHNTKTTTQNHHDQASVEIELLSSQLKA